MPAMPVTSTLERVSITSLVGVLFSPIVLTIFFLSRTHYSDIQLLGFACISASGQRAKIERGGVLEYVISGLG